MTLNSHFTFNFHYYEQRFSDWLHIYRIELFIEYLCYIGISLLYDVTVGDVRKRTVKKVIRRILRLRERIADLSYRRKVAGPTSSEL